ncbi:MAG: M48 family metalloprotease [Tannerellaceae bacterium]|jgi:putative metalloprotease|nr:M48 family metalloprotease [Tannerellaceae bacterium]
MKRNLFFVVIIALSTVFNTQAQLGKALKNAGKSVGKAAGDAAEEIALDLSTNKVSDKLVDWMDKNSVLSADDSPYTLRLNSIVGENFVNVGGASLSYKVYENPEINVLALSNGAIRVYSGLLDTFDDDDEVLAIITTQIGHIVSKDARGALLKVVSEDQATTAATAQLEKLLSASGDKLGTVVNELIQVPYTDEQNKAADKYAADLLKKNGKNPRSLSTALTKLGELEANDIAASESENSALEISPAAKFNRVNSKNTLRAALIR